MKIFEKRIEADFEFFVRNLPALEPVEFLGLAKVLSVPTVRESKILELSKEGLERAKNGEDVDLNVEETLFPADEILEAMMVLSFGISWPLNIIRSLRAKTTKGKSLLFLCFIFFGYIAGITSKFMNESYMANFATKWYVLFFYVLNLVMVSIDFCLYFRNVKLDRARDAEGK